MGCAESLNFLPRGDNMMRAWARGYVYILTDESYFLSPTMLLPAERHLDPGAGFVPIRSRTALADRSRYDLTGDWADGVLWVDKLILSAVQVAPFDGPPWETGLTEAQAAQLEELGEDLDAQPWMPGVQSISTALTGKPPRPHLYIHLRFPPEDARQWAKARPLDVTLNPYLDTTPLPIDQPPAR